MRSSLLKFNAKGLKTTKTTLKMFLMKKLMLHSFRKLGIPTFTNNTAIHISRYLHTYMYIYKIYSISTKLSS